MTRRVLVLAVALATVVLIVAACGPVTPSATRSTSPSAAASPSPLPTATPLPTPTATSVPTPSPSLPVACAVAPQTGQLPSDRFADLKVASGPSGDLLTFVFGPSSLDSPAGPPRGSLDVATAPYTEAGSGAPIAMTGEHVIAIRFSGMSLQNDAGEQIYTGPSQFTPGFPALRQAVLFDASEGIVGWYVGYDGPGCVTLARDGNNVTVTIARS